VSTADAINKFLSELADRLVFMGMMWTKISNIKYEIYNNLPYFLLNDPRPESPDISSVSRYFISFLEPLYVMAILLTGIYLLFFSGTPQGRVRAKSMLISLIMGMVVISVSTYLIHCCSAYQTPLQGTSSAGSAGHRIHIQEGSRLP